MLIGAFGVPCARQRELVEAIDDCVLPSGVHLLLWTRVHARCLYMAMAPQSCNTTHAVLAALFGFSHHEQGSWPFALGSQASGTKSPHLSYSQSYG